MLNGILELIRRKNRARLERRHLAKANQQRATGWLSRLLQRIRARNHDRLAHRRAQRQLLSSIAANDTAVLEALVFLLKSARQERRARAEADEALVRRVAAIEARVDAGLGRIASSLQALEARLPGSSRAGEALQAVAAQDAQHPAPEARTNGALPRASARGDSADERVGPAIQGARAPEPSQDAGAAIATAPARKRF